MPGASVVAIDALAPLVAFLGFDRERRDRTGFEPLERNRLAGLLAKAISALFDALERGVDLGDQLALAVAGPQLDGPVGFRGGPVGKVRVILALVLEMLERLLGLLEDVLPPVEQFQPEILPLALAHERLSVTRPVLSVFRPYAGRFGRLAVLLGLFGGVAVFALEKLHLHTPHPTL